MSVRICIPSKEMRPAASYARSRAAAGVGPRAVTLSTRPPAVTIRPSRSAVPAWVTSASSAAAVQPLDHVALRGALRIAGRGQDERHRPVLVELRLDARRGRPARARRRQRSTRSERSRGSTAWVSGSPKRALNSSTFGPVGADHQARRRGRRGRGARAGHRRQRRPVHGVDDLLDLAAAEAGHRRVAAHAAGVRAPGRRRRSACSPGPGRAAPRSRRRRARAARAPRPRGTPRGRPSVSPKRRSAKKTSTASRGLGLVGADDHALARGQAVGLEHRRVGGGGELLGRLGGAAQQDVRGGRHPGLAHQLLGEGLRALELGGGGARPEGGIPASARASTSAGDERRLGPDHDQVDAPLARRRRRSPRRPRRRPRPGTPRRRRSRRCRARRAARASAPSAPARARSRARARRRR